MFSEGEDQQIQLPENIKVQLNPQELEVLNMTASERNKRANQQVQDYLKGTKTVTPLKNSNLIDLQQGGNLVTLPDGTTHIFPLGTSPEQMQKALNIGPIKPKTNWVDTVRPFVASMAGGAAALGVSAIPGIGESGIAQVAADTQGYALVDSLLKYMGANKPTSYTEALTESEMDAATNAVTGKLINGVFKGVKGFFNAGMPEFYKLAPTTSQAFERFGLKALATVPRFIEDFGVPEAKAAALDRAGGKGFAQALGLANFFNGRRFTTNRDPLKLADAIKGQIELGIDRSSTPGFKTKLHYASQEALDTLEAGNSKIFEQVENVLDDTTKLSKVLKVGQIAGSPAMNVKNDLAAYQFMRMVNRATTQDLKGGVRIDPNKLASMWTDPNMSTNMDLLFGKGGREKISDFFKDIAYTQSGNPSGSQFLKYLKRGSFLLNMGLFYKGMTTGNLGGLVPIGVQVGASGLGRLLTNPTTSRMITEMAKGTFQDNPTWTARLLGTALRNQTVGLVGADGTTKEGTFEEDPKTGDLKFVPDH